MKAYPIPAMRNDGNQYFFINSDRGDLRRTIKDWGSRFFRKNGIALAVAVLAFVWTFTVSQYSAHLARKETEARLSAQYAAEFEARMEAYIAQQEAIERVLGDGSMQAQIEREADAAARAIGTMATKRMKLSMLWNMLVRVDNPLYPNTLEEVIAQPQQWMFYDESNPIRADDKELALEQIKLWHEGRYPAGLSVDFVYGEWSSNDYVLRDRWEKNSRTQYWRFPE